MIPLRDIIPTRTFPFVTIAVIVLNSVAFLYEQSLTEAALRGMLPVFAVVPGDFLWTTLVTSMFLHAGWLHFLGNMLYLWIFGDNVEERLGHGRFVVFYLTCGVVAGLAHVYMNPTSYLPTLGASGAIAGVMGAYFLLYPQSRILTLIPFIIFFRIVEVPAIAFLGIWFVMQFFSGALSTAGASGGVAFWAHVAGFLTGAAWILVFRKRRTDWA
ncbi:MAG: rhomboid family intramembrane serine protease [Acidobacteria bacterium]|nr:rhomboid family intramembrane serine protease [Acidobacteriota bacterium]